MVSKRLLLVKGIYRGLEGVSRSDKGLQGVTGDDKG